MSKDVKLAACMTAGRQEITWCRNQIERSLRQLNIPFNVSGGVYYGQCMQMMLEDLLKTDCQYAITVDGDSVFKPEQLHRLISIIVQESHTIDALASLQVRRGMKSVLGTAAGQRALESYGYPVKITTAHFGLTVISLDKLRNVPKPWFYCQPDENGEWRGEGKIDSDVWFWKQWEKAGNSLYMDLECRIGHTEEMVVMFDENHDIKHFYPSEWEKMDIEYVAKASASEAVETAS